MEIKRVVDGKEMTFPLSEKELTQAYKEKQFRLQCTEVRNYMKDYSDGEIFDICDFGEEISEALSDKAVTRFEKAILRDNDLMAKIYKKFASLQNYAISVAYNADMSEAMEFVLRKEGKKHLEAILPSKLPLNVQIQSASSHTLQEERVSEENSGSTIKVKAEPDEPVPATDQIPIVGETVFGTCIKIFRATNEDMEKLSNEISYWCNGLGELHCGGVDITEDDLPLELQRAYDELWTDEFGSLCYLVKTPHGYGVALLNEYDNCYAGDCGLTMEKLFESALADATAISHHSEFQHADIYVGEHSGFCDCHEVFVIFPATTPVKEFRAAAALLDELAYQSALQPNASLNNQIQSASSRATAAEVPPAGKENHPAQEH